MCILCEPKYVKSYDGKEMIMPITCKVNFHPDNTMEISDELEYAETDDDYIDGAEGFYIDNGQLGCVLEAGYAGDSIPINFCPICGRKLEHKESLNEGE